MTIGFTHSDTASLTTFTCPPDSAVPWITHPPICSPYLCIQYLFIPCGMYMRASGICLSVSELLSIRLPRSMFLCLFIGNNAAVNVGVHLSFWGTVFLFSKSILSRAITGSCGSCIYFSGTSIPFVTVAAPISIPTNSAQGPVVCTPLTTPGVCLWDDCRCNTCEVIADCGFDLCLPDDD